MSHYRYFVECDAHTNEQISKDLSARGYDQTTMLCADGEPRNLWELPKTYINEKLRTNKNTCHFQFTIFRSRGDEPPALLTEDLDSEDNSEGPEDESPKKGQTESRWDVFLSNFHVINHSGNRVRVWGPPGTEVVLEPSPYLIELVGGQVVGLYRAEPDKNKRYIVPRSVFPAVEGREDVITIGEKNSDHIWISECQR